MGLVTACEGCGRGVTGALSRVKKVNGKYLCSECASNPDRAARYYCTNCKVYAPYANNREVMGGSKSFSTSATSFLASFTRSGDAAVTPRFAQRASKLRLSLQLLAATLSAPTAQS